MLDNGQENNCDETGYHCQTSSFQTTAMSSTFILARGTKGWFHTFHPHKHDVEFERLCSLRDDELKLSVVCVACIQGGDSLSCAE